MNAISNRSSLFNESGCLSRDALRLFVSSALPEGEAVLVNEHISSCPFCKDALEGIRLLSEKQYHPAEEKASYSITAEVAGPVSRKDSMQMELDAHTDRINRRLRQRFDYFPGRKRAARNPRLRIFLIPAAASVLVLIGIISYFTFFFPEKNELALLNEKEVAETEPGKRDLIGGIFNKETADKGAQEISRTDKGGEDEAMNDVVSMPEKDVVAADETVTTEEKVILAAVDEEIDQPEPVAENEQISAYAVEKVAGAGLDVDDGKSVSRAKSGRKAAAETNEMIVVYDQAASFPGGADSLYSFLDRYMKYTVVDAQEADTLILVQFEVSKRGSINGFTFIQGAGEEVNKEVLRVLKVMPDWIPAVREGKNVDEVVSLPIYLKTK